MSTLRSSAGDVAEFNPYGPTSFGESAQFIHEIGLRRTEHGTRNFHTRSAARLNQFRDTFLRDDDTAFRASQEGLSHLLSRLIEGVRRISRSSAVDVDDEQLGLGLWVADHSAGTVGCIATADRRLNDPEAVIWNPLELSSRWVAVEAITRGVVVQRDPDLFASRWRFIRGVPLIVEEADAAERSIVGAVTLTSTTPEAQSRLTKVPRGVLGQIDRVLQDLSLLFE